MDCAEALRVQAYFDGEADAAAAADIERHIETCPECQSLLQQLAQVRTLMRTKAPPITVSGALKARILSSLDQEPAAPAFAGKRHKAPVGSRPFWIGVFSGVGGSAVAAALAMLLIVPIHKDRLQSELVADHTRSLASSHLIEVVSTNQHTVKPWFAGRTDVSPVVADFAPQGYRLLGGRIDELEKRHVAVVVYQHGAHFINVFTWVTAAGALPADSTRNGYHLAFWQGGNLAYCAVSDTGWEELRGLENLLREEGNKLNTP